MTAVSRFHVSYQDQAAWQGGGLRDFLEYRELGIREATGGRVKVEHVRGLGIPGAATGWHFHELEFQLVFVLKGYVRFTVEGHGEVTLWAGDSAHLPAGLRHDETEFSPDFEVLNIMMPADAKTVSV